MKNQGFVFAYAIEIKVVDNLFLLSFRAQKIRKNNCMYLSPFKCKREASFRISKRLNACCNRKADKDGGLIDFNTLYQRVTILELIHGLELDYLSFHPHPFLSEMPSDAGEKEKLRVGDEGQIVSQKLIEYLREKRQASIVIARRLCKEIDLVLCHEKRRAAGFRKCAEKYELNNESFKRSNSTKGGAVIKIGHSNRCSVFGGFFNFPSFQMLHEKDKKIFDQLSNKQVNFLNLSSLSFPKKSCELTEKHANIYLYFDRHKADSPVIREALTWSPKYGDKSTYYKFSNDLNEYSRKRYQQQELKEGRRFRMKF